MLATTVLASTVLASTVPVHRGVAWLDAAAGPADSSGLPAHVLMGYWQDFTNGATPLTLADVPTSYNLVAVAFGNATGTPGQVTFSLDSGLSSALGGYTDSQFTSDVQTLHARGQKGTPGRPPAN